MSEFVLVLPLYVVVLALTWYMGRMLVQVERASFMVRYETWRSVHNAPGPWADDDAGHPHLNQAFFANNASQIQRPVNGGYFPVEPYDQMQDAADQFSQVAGDLTEAYIYRPSNNEHRQSRGRHEGFDVLHDSGIAEWARIARASGGSLDNPSTSPLTRRHVRIGTDWPYTNDWRSSAPDYEPSGGNPHHLRALRDAFYLEFDQNFDGIDGDQSFEYDDGQGSQHPGDNLAGMVRRLYLDAPGYRGPIVWDEGSGDEEEGM